MPRYVYKSNMYVCIGYNNGFFIVIMTSLIEPIEIKKGQKIAQLIVSDFSYPEIKKVTFLKDTERNNKGFGEMEEIDFSKGFGKININNGFGEIFEILSPHFQNIKNNLSFLVIIKEHK